MPAFRPQVGKLHVGRATLSVIEWRPGEFTVQPDDRVRILSVRSSPHKPRAG